VIRDSSDATEPLHAENGPALAERRGSSRRGAAPLEGRREYLGRRNLRYGCACVCACVSACECVCDAHVCIHDA
jgi:hypothetical protein